MAGLRCSYHGTQPGIDALVNTMNAMFHPMSLRHIRSRNRREQRGVVAIEFALVFLFGLLPLLLLTFSGVLIFAAKQSLTLAAADGARAALHYNSNASDGNLTDACSSALHDMNWLFELASSGGAPAPSSCTSGSISTNDATATITTDNSCTAAAGATCVRVTTTYNYENSPLVLGTGTLYGWFTSGQLQSSAVIQIYNTQGN